MNRHIGKRRKATIIWRDRTDDVTFTKYSDGKVKLTVVGETLIDMTALAKRRGLTFRQLVNQILTAEYDLAGEMAQ